MNSWASLFFLSLCHFIQIFTRAYVKYVVRAMYKPIVSKSVSMNHIVVRMSHCIHAVICAFQSDFLSSVYCSFIPLHSSLISFFFPSCVCFFIIFQFSFVRYHWAIAEWKDEKKRISVIQRGSIPKQNK